MTSQSDCVQPPPLAEWLLTLFALDNEAESILGDLLEEFTLLATSSGVSFAQKWYWRQTLKTVYQLADHGFRTAPWSTTIAVAGGSALRGDAGRLVEPAIFAVIEKYQIPEHHFGAYVFLATTGIDIGFLITFLLAGFVVAFVAKGREMVATMSLGLFSGALIVVTLPLQVMRIGHAMPLSRQMWSFSDALAFVVAGAIVRTYRLRAAARHQQA